MQPRPLDLEGVFALDPERKGDTRGYFARTYCRQTLHAAGIDFVPTQCSESYNAHRGTLRGLHYQRAPKMETKIVHCTAGAVFDVAVDIRPDSETFGRWVGLELSAENGVGILIPAGFAHGFKTLRDHSTVAYMVSPDYEPDLAAGVLWHDPEIGIDWPDGPPTTISDRDSALPMLATLKS